jgi:hypothetical protein
MEAKLTIPRSPQTLAGDAVRPAASTLRKLTSTLAARPRPMRLLGASFPLAGLAASILAPTADGITQTVQHSRILSLKEKVEFHIYLTR